MIQLIYKIIALLTLVVLMVPALMYFSDRMNLETAKNIMLISTIAWFIVASMLMCGKRRSN